MLLVTLVKILDSRKRGDEQHGGHEDLPKVCIMKSFSPDSWYMVAQRFDQNVLEAPQNCSKCLEKCSKRELVIAKLQFLHIYIHCNFLLTRLTPQHVQIFNILEQCSGT